MARFMLMLSSVTALAAPSPTLAKPSPAALKPVPTSYRALVGGATAESFRAAARVATVETPILGGNGHRNSELHARASLALNAFAQNLIGQHAAAAPTCEGEGAVAGGGGVVVQINPTPPLSL